MNANQEWVDESSQDINNSLNRWCKLRKRYTFALIKVRLSLMFCMWLYYMKIQLENMLHWECTCVQSKQSFFKKYMSTHQSSSWQAIKQNFEGFYVAKMISQHSDIKNSSIALKYISLHQAIGPKHCDDKQSIFSMIEHTRHRSTALRVKRGPKSCSTTSRTFFI